MKNNKKSLFLAYCENLKKKQKYNIDKDEKVIYIDTRKRIFSNFFSIVLDFIKFLIIFIFMILLTVLISIGATVIFNPQLKEEIFTQILNI